MSEQVKPFVVDMKGTGVECVFASDYATLQAECNSLWSTYIALVDKLGIDMDKARKADGKPSDVFARYVYVLQSECETLREQVKLLQSAENSYQAGFDAGRATSAKLADDWRKECERLRAELSTVKKVAYGNLELLNEIEQLRAELAAIKKKIVP